MKLILIFVLIIAITIILFFLSTRILLERFPNVPSLTKSKESNKKMRVLASKGISKKTTRKKGNKSGFAETKKSTQGRIGHPALYKRKTRDSDDVDYVTFTHSNDVTKDNGKKLETHELNKNIDPNVKDKNDRSHVVLVVYEGKRSALGKERPEFKITDIEDKKYIEELFKNGKREQAPKKKK